MRSGRLRPIVFAPVNLAPRMLRTTIVVFSLAALAAAPRVLAQDTPKETPSAVATHVIEDGQLQAVEAFSDKSEWIRE